MNNRGFLGIDLGTQGLSLMLTDEQLHPQAVSAGQYDMLPGLPEGCYEQDPADWLGALRQASRRLWQQVGHDWQVLAIGVSGQMHGEVLADEQGQPVGPVRLWCDSRNSAEEAELTAALGVKMPKRMTAVRWLWTTRNQPNQAAAARHLTTPAGWLSYQLTGQWNLGIGDAAGMFPIDQETLDYDRQLLTQYQQIVSGAFPSLSELLPRVCLAGADAGVVSESAADSLGLPAGTPVAAGEGDQPAALTGSLISASGTVSVSFGTSVCANSVGDRPFQGVDRAVDHFCAPDGKPINMVWLRNGTTFMNVVMEMFGDLLVGNRQSGFDQVIPALLQAPAECGGLLALPFMDDEPGLGVHRGGTAMVVGLNGNNATAGNLAKAALLATMFNLRLGCQVLDRQGFPRNQLVLTGGLTKTPQLAQILADVFATPVRLLAGSDEGTAWGAAVLAKYRYLRQHETLEWGDFLDSLQPSQEASYQPDPGTAKAYDRMFLRYTRLMELQERLDQAVAPHNRS